MKTKTIFDEGGVQVWETNNGDFRGKEWHITDGENGCSVGFKPELDPVWIKQYLAEYQKDKAQEHHDPLKDIL